MKRIHSTVYLLMFVMLISSTTYSQDSYTMFESIILTPNPSHVSELGEAMAIHNNKYHQEGAHESYVYHISSGPNVGKMVWMMGPCTWSDLDTRPGEGAHDEDWIQNVVPHLNGVENGEYWKRDDKLSLPAVDKQFPLILVRYHNVDKFQEHRVDAILKKISDTVKTIEGIKSWSIYDNQLRQGYEIGRHLAIVIGMDKWAELGIDLKFEEAFNKLNGENSYSKFSLEWNEVFSNAWDEVWSYDAKLSGKK